MSKNSESRLVFLTKEERTALTKTPLEKIQTFFEEMQGNCIDDPALKKLTLKDLTTINVKREPGRKNPSYVVNVIPDLNFKPKRLRVNNSQKKAISFSINKAGLKWLRVSDKEIDLQNVAIVSTAENSDANSLAGLGRLRLEVELLEWLSFIKGRDRYCYPPLSKFIFR